MSRMCEEVEIFWTPVGMGNDASEVPHEVSALGSSLCYVGEFG